ncbi:MAG TPA: AAA family ATPase [Armatimonadota bacterium]|nr:AAA family ATPase [Armatimonadota bacterium]
MRVEEFLSKITPNIKGVSVRSALSKEALEFRQSTRGSSGAWRFLAANMSDGTLRALGILVALFQCAAMGENPTPLIGIEEPETALHPAAAGILRDALRAAARHTQILIASHSPELLDDKSISDKSIRVVSNEDGITTIAPVDEASRASIRESLYTAGELLRMDQLEPDAKNVQEQTSRQLDLFAKIAS